jgi:uncharacterized protein
MSLYAVAAGTFVPMLENLSAILAHSEEAGLLGGGEDLVNARLAADMYPLTYQISLACWMAQVGMASLAGREAPPQPQPCARVAEMRDQIGLTIAYVSATPEASFAGAEARDCSFTSLAGLRFGFKGQDFLIAWVLPQFYFHVTTAYAILRHHKLDIGKRDYLASAAKFLAQGA